MRAVAIARKDLRELPIYFKISICAVPLVMAFITSMLIIAGASPEAASELPNLPDSLFPPGLTGPEKSIYFALNFIAPPYFLMLATILPITIAADAFAGERERKTLESLLALPLSSRDLFFAKALLPLSYGFGASLLAFLAITVVAKLTVASPLVRMPNLTWLLLIFLAVPAFSLLAVVVELIISTRVDRTYYAVQVGSILILALLIFVVGGLTGFLVLSPTLLLLVSGAVFLLDYILIEIGSDFLSRGL